MCHRKNEIIRILQLFINTSVSGFVSGIVTLTLVKGSGRERPCKLQLVKGSGRERPYKLQHQVVSAGIRLDKDLLNTNINTLVGLQAQHGWDFSSCSQILGFRFLSESNENSTEMHFACYFASFRMQTLTLSRPCHCQLIS